MNEHQWGGWDPELDTPETREGRASEKERPKCPAILWSAHVPSFCLGCWEPSWTGRPCESRRRYEVPITRVSWHHELYSGKCQSWETTNQMVAKNKTLQDSDTSQGPHSSRSQQCAFATGPARGHQDPVARVDSCFYLSPKVLAASKQAVSVI